MSDDLSDRLREFASTGKQILYSGSRPQTLDDVREAADEIDRLRQLIDSLDIVVMHPDMSGEHQCSIRANGRKLTREQWDTILSTRDAS